jgi:hypothetical protein
MAEMQQFSDLMDEYIAVMVLLKHVVRDFPAFEAPHLCREQAASTQYQIVVSNLCLANCYEGPFLPLIALRECDEFPGE